jgi:hypothetical protein
MLMLCRISVTFVSEKDGTETTVQVPIGQHLLEAAHRNDIELEGAQQLPGSTAAHSSYIDPVPRPQLPCSIPHLGMHTAACTLPNWTLFDQLFSSSMHSLQVSRCTINTVCRMHNFHSSTYIAMIVRQPHAALHDSSSIRTAADSS